MEKDLLVSCSKKGLKKMFSKMPLQFTPIAFGVMLVVAVGTLAYGIWNMNSNRQSPHGYGSRNDSFDYQCGHDTYKWDEKSDNERRKRKKTENSICSICLDTLKSHLKTLPCQHVFHADCIKVWFQDNNTCPICRTNSNTQ